MTSYDFAPPDHHQRQCSEPTDLKGLKLVPRVCACGCGLRFKTLADSSQEFATRDCWQTKEEARRAHNVIPTHKKKLGGKAEWRAGNLKKGQRGKK